jgi:GAF domain-containing protein
VIEDDGGQRASAAVQLQELLLDTEDVDTFLHQVALLAADGVVLGASCGITLRRADGPLTVASSDALAARVDEVQYSFGDGPCLTSMETGQVVLVGDVAEDDRWSPYRTRALEHGVRSSLAVPLAGRGRPTGALNLYSPHPSAFSADHVGQAERLARQAALAVALALRMSEKAELTANLRAALTSRAVIDQALGVIMGQNRCTPEEAFDVLRSASQNRNVKLRTMAAEIVQAVSGCSPLDDPRFV